MVRRKQKEKGGTPVIQPELTEENREAIRRDIERRNIVETALTDQLRGTTDEGIANPADRPPEFFTPSAQRITSGGGSEAPIPTEGVAPVNVIGGSIGGVEEEIAQVEAEQRPERRELDPVELPGSTRPVIGAIASPVTNAINQWLSSGASEKYNIKKRDVKDEFLLKPENLRTAALTEIEAQVYKDGITASEAVGTIFDVLPFSEFIGGIETPTGNILAIRRNIKKEKTRANFNLQLVRQGDLTVEVGKELIDSSMLNIQKYESRIKLLVNYSPDLRFNSDEINVIETEILTVREIIFAAQKEVLRGKIEDAAELQTWIALHPIDYGDLD